jgi:hypothetical protein
MTVKSTRWRSSSGSESTVSVATIGASRRDPRGSGELQEPPMHGGLHRAGHWDLDQR